MGVLTYSKGETAAIFEAITSGAQGYMRKDLTGREFLRLLEGLERDEQLLSQGAPEPLTGREQEVLGLLVQGVTTTQELSARLVVTDNTIKFHLRNILDKLHVHNRAEVVAYASRYGLAASG